MKKEDIESKKGECEMYKHHEESLEIMKNYFEEMPGVIAVIFGGSVAKGCERPDSDLDAIIVLEEKFYKKRLESNTATETISGLCTYEEGYFDVKYITKEILELTAVKGSEPARNAFVGNRVIYSTDESIAETVRQIPVFQKSEYEDKMLSFHSNFSLNYSYFWKCCNIDGYMRLHVANEIVYSIYRMILQQNAILFPCHRRLEEFVDKAPAKPDNIVQLANSFIKTMGDSECDDFVQAYLNWTTYKEPEDYNQILTRYCADYEQWWRIPRPLVEEW